MKRLLNIVAIIIGLIANLVELYSVWLLTLSKEPVSFVNSLVLHLVASILIFIAVAFSFKKVQKETPDDNKLAEQETEEEFEHIVHPEIEILERAEKELETKETEQVKNPLLWPSFFLSFFLPIFGVLVTSVLAILISPNEKKESEVFDDYIDYIRLNASDRPRFSSINFESHVAGKLNLEPIVDLLSSNKKSVVWGSLENLSHRSDSLAVSLIKQTIQRSDMDIKYLSSLGLDRIESSFSKKLALQRTALKKDSSIENYLNLFKIVLQYINSGLLDKELSENLIIETLESISQANETYPGNPTIDSYKATLLLNLNRLEEAGEIFKNLIDKKMLADNFKIQACEVFFQKADLEIVEKLIAELTNNEFNQGFIEKVQFETELSDLREFWLKEENI